MNVLFRDQSNRLDPTGTSGIRRSFRAEADRRMAQLRSMMHEQLVGRDFMRHRGDPLYPTTDPHERFGAFERWFRQALSHLLGSDWYSSFLRRAWDSGLSRGGEMVGTQTFAPPPITRMASAKLELEGMLAAMHQQIMRVASITALARTRPAMMYRQISLILRRAMTQRLRAWINFSVVQFHNAGRLHAFRLAGVRRIGVQAERLPPLLPTRDHHVHISDISKKKLAEIIGSAEKITKKLKGYGLVNVQTAEDDRVCDICDDIASEGPYDIDEAQSLIPAHINCRCGWIPADEDD